MAGYTKLFSSIIASTIWRESKETKIVWITLLAMANADGRVDASIPGLADMARVTVAECQSALEVLQSPDSFSRSKEFDGRRIEEIPGGFQVLNYAKYRENRDPEVRREQNRQAQARFRAKSNQVSHSKPKVSRDKPQSAQAEAKAEASDLPPAAPPVKVRARNPLFDAFATACGSDPLQMPATAARTCAVKLAEILRACPTIAPDDFTPRAERYRLIFPNASLTPAALCSHWAECDPSKPFTSHATNSHSNSRMFSGAHLYAGVTEK